MLAQLNHDIMNADLVLSTLTFSQAYSDKDEGSLRREISRGVNLPTLMRINHSDYVDSKTKLSGVRSRLGFEHWVATTDGAAVPIIVNLTVAIPNDALITSAMVLAAVEFVAQTIQEDDSGLNLASNVFVSKEQ